MTDIIVTPACEFDLSLSDRSRPGGPWLHSFLGTISFTGETEVEESDVPIVFILVALIETAILIRHFGLKSRTIPIPSTDRELEIEGGKGVILSCIKVGKDKIDLNIRLDDSDIRHLFDTVVQLMRNWQPTRLDDEYFLRSSWLLGAALETAQGKAS